LRGSWALSAPVLTSLGRKLGLGMGGRLAEFFALEWSAFRERRYMVHFTLQLARDAIGRGNRLKGVKGKKARTTLVLPSWWDHHRPRGRARQQSGTRPAAPSHGCLLDQHALRCRRGERGRAGVACGRHTYSRLIIEADGSRNCRNHWVTLRSKPLGTTTATSQKTQPRRLPALALR
jgi:hypothetical protein